MKNNKSRVLLESWEHHTNADPYKAPECIVEWFTGIVFGHPKHEDGTWVITSTMCSDNCDGDITTLNTEYTLGAHKDEY